LFISPSATLPKPGETAKIRRGKEKKRRRRRSRLKKKKEELRSR